MARVLVASADSILSGSILKDTLSHTDVLLVDVLTGQTSLDALLQSGSKYGSAVVACGSKASLDPGFLGKIAKALQPGARVSLQLAASGASQDEAKSALVLSGFVDCEPSGTSALTAAAPSWGVGAKSALLKKPKAAPAPVVAVAAAAANGGAWKLALDDEDGDELVDDEELLTEEDKLRPLPAPAGDDCEVGKAGRKACKDCTCGRAEAEAAGVKVQLTEEMLQNPGVGSSCGNCSLGDAFRCAGCPYRGLPAFEPGKPLTLPTDFLMADA